MDQDSIDRIRGATFSVGRRGYDKREVDRFLTKLADWLEGGGGDESRSELIKRDLERVGEKTKSILTAAEDAAQELRAEGESERDRVKQEAARQREEASQENERHLAAARTESERIVDEANRKRGEIEELVAELEARRDAVVSEVERLANQVTGTAPSGEQGGGSDSEERVAASQRDEP